MESQDQKLPTDPQEVREFQKRLVSFAQDVYHTLQPGMMLTVAWQDNNGIVVPGRPAVTHQLIITRPTLSVRIKTS